MFVPRIPNQFDEDAQQERLAGQFDSGGGPRRWLAMVLAGVVILGLFGVLAAKGLPGSGLVLVPIGLVLILVGGIPLVIDRLARL